MAAGAGGQDSMAANYPVAAPAYGGEAPPQQMTMGGFDQFLTGQGFLMRQSTSECCKFGPCQPNIHFNIHPYNDGSGRRDGSEDGPVVAFVQENAPYCGRCCTCCVGPGFRATTYSVFEGPGNEDGEPVNGTGSLQFTHSKGTTCPVSTVVRDDNGNEIRLFCCCCLPYLETKDQQ